MKKIRAGIIGGAGYTGGELIRLLINHPGVEIKFVNSRSNAGNPVTTVHRDLIGDTDIVFTEFPDWDVDVIYICSGHGEARKFMEGTDVPENVAVIDLSHDFRLEASRRIGKREFVYGLPELNLEKIKSSRNIANPGCFATCIQLTLLPLAKAGLLTSEVHISAATGSTGAGQKPSPTTHFSWRSDNFSVYKPFTHQHLGEIGESIRSLMPSFAGPVNFIPYRGGFTRGIFASVYTDCVLTEDEAGGLYKEYYAPHPFVNVCSGPIDMKQVVNTNKCLLHIEKHGDKLLITGAIDNLLKGASGQAVENMNIMFGLDRREGLRLKPAAF